MTEARLESWSSGGGHNPTGDNLDNTTHGSGTTSERTAITSWPANKPFFDETLAQWFSNTHVSAPSSITWTAILGRQPLKRRFIHHAIYNEAGSISSGSTYYFGPFGKLDGEAIGLTRTNAEAILTSQAVTVKRFRARQTLGANITDDISLLKDAVVQSTLDLSSANPADSGDISIAYDGTEKMSFCFDAITSAAPYSFEVWIEVEFDDVY